MVIDGLAGNYIPPDERGRGMPNEAGGMGQALAGGTAAEGGRMGAEGGRMGRGKVGGIRGGAPWLVRWGKQQGTILRVKIGLNCEERHTSRFSIFNSSCVTSRALSVPAPSRPQCVKLERPRELVNEVGCRLRQSTMQRRIVVNGGRRDRTGTVLVRVGRDENGVATIWNICDSVRWAAFQIMALQKLIEEGGSCKRQERKPSKETAG
ncbi:hypothetical protein C8F04DRAFT_1204166 [Mycena alexandri]|uniref:Uncharacterized protein n=1 Tax=Mycena alexandri TaxID=1745969 RepID=A0AAD6RW27_9AGAR|nr:hypothetical protein C8F04DRAFT_1204166 [Mycena alexandri]